MMNPTVETTSTFISMNALRGDFAAGQRTYPPEPILGDFATGLRRLVNFSFFEDSAAGMREHPLSGEKGDFATGQRTALPLPDLRHAA